MHIHNISLKLKWQDVADNPGLLWLGIKFNILHYSRCRWVSRWTNLHIMFNLRGIFCSPWYLSTEGFGDLDVVLFERHFNPSLPQHFQSPVLLMYKFAPSQNADSWSLFGIFADTASHIEKMIEMTSNLFWRSPSHSSPTLSYFFALLPCSAHLHVRIPVGGFQTGSTFTSTTMTFAPRQPSFSAISPTISVEYVYETEFAYQ